MLQLASCERRPWHGLAATLLAVPLAAVLALPAGAVPPDPQRPFTARTCKDAKARFAEATRGSPLISAAENRSVVAAARAERDRLCGKRRAKRR